MISASKAGKEKVVPRWLWPLLLGSGLFFFSYVSGLVDGEPLSDDAAHSPLLLTIGLWLLVRRLRELEEPLAAPGSVALIFCALLPVCFFYLVARALDWTTIAGYTAWAGLVITGFAFLGPANLRRLSFPILYMLLALPLPAGTTVALTQDLRLFLSDLAVSLLGSLGYPVAQTGITIVVGAYELLVQDACSGLKSLVSLLAVALFYAYIRHKESWTYWAVLIAVAFIIAMIANLARILSLLLITYHFGDAVGTGLAHDITGLLVFVLAIAGVFVADRLLAPVRRLVRAAP